jgi:hypothetical protein
VSDNREAEGAGSATSDAPSQAVAIVDATPLAAGTEAADWSPASSDMRMRVAAGPLIEAFPMLGAALRSGDVVRITGPAALVRGLRDGSLHMMSTSTGMTGDVMNASNSIVGKLRLGPVSVAPAQLAAVFAVASVATLQYYLQAITEQLDQISIQLGSVLELISGSAAAELENAFRVSEHLGAVLDNTGALIDRDFVQLSLAEDAATTAYLRDLSFVERIAAEATRLSTNLDEAGATVDTSRYPRGLRKFKADLKRLHGELPIAAHALERLLLAADVRARLLVLRSAAESRGDASRADVIVTRARHAMGEMALEMGALAPGLGAFQAIDDRVVSQLFYVDTKVNEAMTEFRSSFGQSAPRAAALVGVLTQLSSAAVEVVEVRAISDGQLEVATVN